MHARRIALVTLMVSLFGTSYGFGADVRFMRGDANCDGALDISDAIHTLVHLFAATGVDLACEDAFDANDDGAIDVADAVYSLGYLFANDAPPPHPSLSVGCDPTGEDALSCHSYLDNVSCETGGAIVADHTCCDVTRLPPAAIEAVRTTFRIWYGHTSHGSQIMSGIGVMRDALFNYNDGAGTLSIRETGGDLGNPDSTTWATKTREQLERGDNDRNLVMWSWCGQASGRSEEMMREDYLELMDSLEIEYPDVIFVYMTGHLDGTGVDGNLHQRNEQIRTFCRHHGKVLFDFADIESYGPDGSYYLDKAADDNCDWRDPDTGGSRNWAEEWCAVHPDECATCSCAHSQCLNCQLKGRAFWWMMARLAGWDGQ